MANVLAELTEQLAKKVGGDDVARGIVEGFKMQKGATRSTVQKQVRGILDNIDADDAIRQAKIADNFAEGAGGQMVIKGLESSAGASTVNEAVEQVSKNADMVDGQLSMFADSTGQMHSSGTKIRQIQEARQSSKYGKMESHLRDGADGQMYMDFGGMKDPSTLSKGGDVVDEAVNNVSSQIDGQTTFLKDKNGYLNTEGGLQQMRQAEVDKANRSWGRRRLDDASKAWNDFTSNASDVVTGRGDASKRVGGRKTRAEGRANANAEYIETGRGSAQTKKEYRRNTRHKNASTAEPGPSTNQSDYTSIFDDLDTAQEKMSGFDWSGIKGWIDDNTALAAGIAVGAGVLGGAGIAGVVSLLDDDDD